MEEKPADVDEVNPDEAEDVSLDEEEEEEFDEPEEVTLDSLVTQFIQGKLIFTISINLAFHCGGSFAVSPHFIVLLCRGNRNV